MALAILPAPIKEMVDELLTVNSGLGRWIR